MTFTYIRLRGTKIRVAVCGIKIGTVLVSTSSFWGNDVEP